jgi:hypothetical protein
MATVVHTVPNKKSRLPSEIDELTRLANRIEFFIDDRRYCD